MQAPAFPSSLRAPGPSRPELAPLQACLEPPARQLGVGGSCGTVLVLGLGLGLVAGLRQRRTGVCQRPSKPDVEEAVTDEPGPLQSYDPPAFRAYFGTRPVDVVFRLLEIAYRAGGWVLDFSGNRADEGQMQRLARGLRDVLASLGPSFVKLGQVLSSRVDLLPEAYIRELRTLTDNVQPYSFDIACRILEEEWAMRSSPIKARDFPETPIAAASLGQVYKVQTPDGQLLAVKVQRPGVREQVCLDLFLLRTLAPLAKRYLRLNSNLEALVDEYGQRFVAELDYNREADNAEGFKDLVARMGLDSVCTAAPVRALTTQKVLVTEWVEGERIDANKGPDGARLCGVALTAYLTMLLETGQLHADPHPGNLLRTTDGRLCILDWGLVTTVDSSQQDAIISYFTHILAEDYEAVPEDLVRLGFIAEGMGQVIADKGVAKAISAVFKGLASGGSARKRVRDIVPEVQEVRRRYGNIGQLPAYFTYILRAFSVLEGIGLDQDPDYAIVSDCYPYLVSRLLREDGERATKVLEALLYGPSKDPGVDRPPLNAGRFLKLMNAVGTFSRQAAKPKPEEHAEEESQEPRQGRRLTKLLRQLSRSEALQEIVVGELARGADVLSREALEALVPPILGGLAPPRTKEDEAVLNSWQDISTAVLGDVANSDGSSGTAGVLQSAAETLLLRGPPPADAVVGELFNARGLLAASSLRFAASILERAAARAAQGAPQGRRRGQ